MKYKERERGDILPGNRVIVDKGRRNAAQGRKIGQRVYEVKCLKCGARAVLRPSQLNGRCCLCLRNSQRKKKRAHR